MSLTVAQVLDGVALVEPLPGEVADAAVSGLEYDSRRVGPGHLFFAFLGHRQDGRRYAPQARERGALAVACDAPQPDFDSGPWIRVADVRRALALAARRFFRPAVEAVSLTGITGTNGKTTTAYLTDSVLRASGRTTALVGTIEYQIAGRARPAGNTTPESLDLYRIFDELRQQGGSHATMEVSSHALAQGRVAGLAFHTAVFTNLSRDHLDYHSTLESYFAAKCELFRGDELPAPGWAVLNRDDAWAARIPVAPGVETLWYGLDEGAGVRATEIRSGFDGLRFTIEWRGGRWSVTSPLLGRMNVSNMLAAFAAGVTYGLDPDAMVAGFEACQRIAGRFERVDEGQEFLVVVDYAHTDDALRKATTAARELDPARVITVFGCGGDRDRNKRPLMGQAAGEGSDLVILTSDNPRNEDPIAIMNDALVGLGRCDTPYRTEPDRESAIRLAFSEARAGDLVLIAGKGHETYQILKDRTIDFDDREVARRILRERGAVRGPR